MSDEAGFLKSIADEPAERSTRLVYADWLDENERACEAEFLRLQIQAAELSAKLLELGGQLDVTWLTAVGNARDKSQDIALRSGRSIRLDSLRQWNFNSGWLEGGPTSQQNREAVQRLVAEEELRRGELPYLIQPTERPFDPARLPNRGPRGWLPDIVCVGGFNSLSPAKDTNRDGSELTIIWFQHEFAFPIAADVREQIRAIDWDQHAHDFDW